MSNAKPISTRSPSSPLVACCFLWGLNQVAAKAALPEIPRALAGRRCARSAARCWSGLWARVRAASRCSSATARAPAALLAGAAVRAPSSPASSSACSSRPRRAWSSSSTSRRSSSRSACRSSRAPSGCRALQIAGLAVAFAGVAWAFAEGFTQPAAGAHQWVGDALGVLAAVLWGATTLAVRATRADQRIGREDAALPARDLGRAARRRGAGRRMRRCRRRCRRSRGARSRSRSSSSRSSSYLRLVLADAPLPGDAAVVVHAADAGVRAGARRACCSASRSRARLGLALVGVVGRHLAREPAEARAGPRSRRLTAARGSCTFVRMTGQLVPTRPQCRA